MEYRPNFQSKHFKGILSAENEKEILTSLLPKKLGKIYFGPHIPL